MSALSTRVKRMFQRAWRAFEKPTLTAIRPIAYWSLPSGWSYDEEVDAIVDSSGTVLPNPEDYWASDTIYIVPLGETADLLNMMTAGLVPSGTVDVLIMQQDVATVNQAHAVQLNGEWYDVVEVAQTPVGHSQGIWARVRLQRRS